MTVPLRQSLNSFMKMQLRNHQDIIYLDIVYARKKIDIKKKKKKTLWPLFIDGVQLPQGWSHLGEAVYFLPLSSKKFLVLILSTSEG